MKHYDVNDEQTKVFDSFGAFFAFGQKQFDEKKVDGISYTHAGAGLITPAGTANALFEALEKINNSKVSWELENNSKHDIIFYNLANYECQITMDYSDAVDNVKDYGITEKEVAAVWPEYFNHCIDNDYF